MAKQNNEKDLDKKIVGEAPSPEGQNAVATADVSENTELTEAQTKAFVKRKLDSLNKRKRTRRLDNVAQKIYNI